MSASELESTSSGDGHPPAVGPTASVDAATADATIAGSDGPSLPLVAQSPHVGASALMSAAGSTIVATDDAHDVEKISPLRKGRASAFSTIVHSLMALRRLSDVHDDEDTARRRREEAFTIDDVICLEEFTEDNFRALKSLFNRHLHCTLAKDVTVATTRDFYLSLAYTVRDQIMGNWIRTASTYYNTDPKVREAEMKVQIYLGYNIHIMIEIYVRGEVYEDEMDKRRAGHV